MFSASTSAVPEFTCPHLFGSVIDAGAGERDAEDASPRVAAGLRFAFRSFHGAVPFGTLSSASPHVCFRLV